MPPERGDWFADEEGNLTAPDTPPGDPNKPPTDEFGRDDPDSIERERRRRERQERRRGGGRSSSGGGGGGIGGVLRRRRKPKPAEEPEAAGEPEAIEPVPVAEPTVERPARARAASGRDALRQRMGRDRGTPAAPPPRRGRPGPPAAGGSSAFRRRRIAALALALVGVLVLWFLVAFFQPPPFDPGDGGGRVAVEIPRGASASEVADLLGEKGVISRPTLFEWRLKLSGKTDKLVSGPVALASGMSYGAAIDRLTGGAGEANTLVIPEGESRDQIAPIAADAGISGDYLAASKASQGFDPATYGATKPSSLEGFLFPATYEVKPGETATDLVTEQLTAFRNNIAGVDFSFAKKKNLTLYDVLTIASMIDREVQVAKERPLVAAVIYNRLHAGMPLGIDATTRFQFHNYTEPLTQQQLSTPSPYNTRLTPGLPPTPIGNPGLDAIKAAAQPAKVNYLFYVVKPGSCGEHNFTNSEAEFEKLAQEYQQALQAAGGSPTDCSG